MSDSNVKKEVNNSNVKKEVNNSTYWYYIVPICVILLLLFFVHVLFHVSSIQSISKRRVYDIIRNLPNSSSFIIKK